jgi:hypothetical protein
MPVDNPALPLDISLSTAIPHPGFAPEKYFHNGRFYLIPQIAARRALSCATGWPGKPPMRIHPLLRGRKDTHTTPPVVVAVNATNQT